jgi:serine/threonine protein kinase
MTYCINPRCDHRQNPNNAELCQNCGTPLLIHHRYRLVRPLRDLDRDYNAEIFEIVDCEDEYRRKILKILAKRDPYFVELFQQEQTLLTQFQHPGIPRGEEAFEFVFSNNGSGFNLHCLVMERIEGTDLEDWIQANPPANGSMNEPTVIDWLKQIAEILSYVHQKNFFHRDIKPSNIMRRNTGQLVLIDFGTARNVSQTVVDGRRVTIIQSMGYTAPEQLVGQAVPESDFYALGRTFVYLLTGKHPDTITPPESWRQQTQTVISEPLKEVIDLLMAQEPTARPQNLPELLTKIQQYPANANKTTQLPSTLVQPSLLASPKTSKSPILLSKKPLIASGIGLVGLFATIMVIRSCVIPPNISTSNAETCDKNVEDLLSCGEQIFLPKDALDSEIEPPKEKEDGVKAIQSDHLPHIDLKMVPAR